MRCTEWRLRNTSWQFGRHGGAAICELNVRSRGMGSEYIDYVLSGVILYVPPTMLIFTCLVGGYLTCLLCRFARWRHWRVLRWPFSILGGIATGVATVLFALLGFSLTPGTFAYVDGSLLFLIIFIAGSCAAFVPGLLVAWYCSKKLK